MPSESERRRRAEARKRRADSESGRMLYEDEEGGRIKVKTVNDGVSITQQHHREQCCIKTMYNRFVNDGVPLPTPYSAHYGDDSGPRSLQEMLGRVEEIEDRFEQLPADVRALARNDPWVLETMLSDPRATQELVNAGLPVAGMEPEETPGAAPVAPSSPQPAANAATEEPPAAQPAETSSA